MKTYDLYCVAASLVLAGAAAGMIVGYHWPRDVEIESTKPVVFEYQVTAEAAKFLVLKSMKGCTPFP